MSNKFPLIVNVGSGQIQELPSGDNLDLTGSNISNVGNISLNNVTIGSASSIFTAVVPGSTTTTTVATATALTELFNWNGNTVQDDLSNVALTTNGSNWSLSTTRTKFNTYSWYNINSSATNYFQTDYNVDPLNSSSNWTIDMWIYADPAGSSSTQQTILNGNLYGSGASHIWLYINGSTPTNGTIILDLDNGGTNRTIGTMTGAGWYHVGIMKSSGVLYGLFNGVVTQFSGSTTFPNNYLQVLGGSNGNAFSSGYICNMRISPNYALFNTVGGTYTLPVAGDYSAGGNITINTVGLATNALIAPALNANIADVSISGGTNGYVLSTDGGGGLSWIAGGGGGAGSFISNGQSNVSIPSADGDILFQSGSSANAFVINTSGSAVLKRYKETVRGYYNESGGYGGWNQSTNLRLGSIWKYTLTGNITVNQGVLIGGSDGSIEAGSSWTWLIDNRGGYTLTSDILFANGIKTLTTGYNIISWFYDGTYVYASLTSGYA